MTFSIREAGERDYPALCQIIEQVDQLHREKLPGRFKASEGPVREAEFILNAIAAQDSAIFVAESAGSVVGFLHIGVRETPQIPIFVSRRYAVIDSLAVRKSHRRLGIGEALMESARRWAGSRGAQSIELNVYRFNRDAIAFYQHLGYQILSHRMVKDLESDTGPSQDTAQGGWTDST